MSEIRKSYKNFVFVCLLNVQANEKYEDTNFLYLFGFSSKEW
jgi:hypothetical protein